MDAVIWGTGVLGASLLVAGIWASLRSRKKSEENTGGDTGGDAEEAEPEMLRTGDSVCHLTRASGHDAPCLGARCTAWLRSARAEVGWCAALRSSQPLHAGQARREE